MSDVAIEGGDPHWRRRHGVDRLVARLEGAIAIPGARGRVELDPSVGLFVPGGGDALGGVVSLTSGFVAMQHRVSVWMVGNIAMTAAIGGTPGRAFLLLMAAAACAALTLWLRRAWQGGPR